MINETKFYEGNIMYMNYIIDPLTHIPSVNVGVHSPESENKDIYFDIYYHLTDKDRDKSYNELYELIYDLTKSYNLGSVLDWFGKLEGSKVVVVEIVKNGEKSYKLIGNEKVSSEKEGR